MKRAHARPHPRQALKAINLWYGHPLTSVLLVDTPLPEGEWTNTFAYWDRGWCRMEILASAMVKNAMCLIHLSQLTGEETDWVDVFVKGKGARLPPMSPTAFAAMIEEGLAKAVGDVGEIRFTHSGDAKLVSTIYKSAFMTEMGNAAVLSYCGLEWDDAAGLELCEALRYAHQATDVFTKLKTLLLNENKLGDGFVKSFAALLNEGGLTKVEWLDLQRNSISDQGMQELADAIERGGLPLCRTILLGDNPGSAAPVSEALKERKK